jgi:ATP-dependent helicase/nuclease subunit A
MVITDDEILIVDFKTNRPSPQDAKDIPAIYRKQLKLYAEVIAKIYPSHKIRTALLWTDRADLMEIEHIA